MSRTLPAPQDPDGRPTETSRAASTMTTASRPATRYADEKVKTSTSSPIRTNSTAFKISSTSAQNRSRWSIVVGDMAKLRPWLPIKSPATTMAIGPDR